ncbi:MAG: hypothetical protein M1296_07625 [Chloroflexi bacterium]|nr:hypothetical protein [Chloroflexota bacterium]
MIRQLRRLTRSFKLGNVEVKAPAVYGRRVSGVWRLDDADDTGYEGVACVDDAARVARLFLEAGRVFDLPEAVEEAEGYLRFILALQQPSGRFANFITSWSGEVNLTGPTSQPEGAFWNARAMRAMALAAATTGNETYLAAFERVFNTVFDRCEGADILALHILATLDVQAVQPSSRYEKAIRRWCQAVSEMRAQTGVLRNYHDEGDPPHLWGHLQPQALARAGMMMGEAEWVGVARDSVDRLLVPLVEHGLMDETMIAYEVSCIVANLLTIAEATGEKRYSDLSHAARTWFRGANSAHQPIYNAFEGWISDGIHGGVASPNSGAESNAEGGLALLDELPWPLYYPHGEEHLLPTTTAAQ